MPRSPKREGNSPQSASFEGFPRPHRNSFSVPNMFIEILSQVETVAELKILLYVMRHTWGFQEYNVLKHLTTDELMNGRKRRDGSRMDGGTGLSEKSIYNGIQAALQHGFLVQVVDDSDRARVKRYFALKMLSEDVDPADYDVGDGRSIPGNSGVEGLTAGVVNLTTQPGWKSLPPGPETLPPQVVKNPERTENPTTEEQHGVGDVVGILVDSGISTVVANDLVHRFPGDYILTKVALVRWLEEKHPDWISRNPAGYLRRAIEQDYSPPREYQRVSKEQERRREAEKELARMKDEARARILEQSPAEAIPGTALTTSEAWDRTLSILEAGMSRANFETWFAGTALASCSGSDAIVAVATAYQLEALESRLDRIVEGALERVLGFRPACRFVIVRDLLPDTSA